MSGGILLTPRMEKMRVKVMVIVKIAMMTVKIVNGSHNLTINRNARGVSLARVATARISV